VRVRTWIYRYPQQKEQLTGVKVCSQSNIGNPIGRRSSRGVTNGNRPNGMDGGAKKCRERSKVENQKRSMVCTFSRVLINGQYDKN